MIFKIGFWFPSRCTGSLFFATCFACRMISYCSVSYDYVTLWGIAHCLSLSAYYLLLSAYCLVPEQRNDCDARFWDPPWVYVALVQILGLNCAKRKEIFVRSYIASHQGHLHLRVFLLPLQLVCNRTGQVRNELQASCKPRFEDCGKIGKMCYKIRKMCHEISKNRKIYIFYNFLPISVQVTRRE